jgi:hypothetical protein
LASQLFWVPFVIIVQKSDVVTARFANPGVSCRRSTPTAIMSNEPDSIVVKVLDDLADTIIGSIVHDNNFEIAKGLAEHAPDRRRQELGAIARRYDHADLWHCHLSLEELHISRRVKVIAHFAIVTR